MKKKLVIAIISIIMVFAILVGCSKKNKDSGEVNKDFDLQKANPYQQDFLYLVTTIEEVHPNPYQNISKTQWEASKKEVLDYLGNNVSFDDFLVRVSSFVSNIKDGHTFIRNDSIYSKGKLIDITLGWMGNDLVVIDTENPLYQNILGYRVVSINAVGLKDAVTKINSLLFSENLYFARENNINFIRNPLVLKKLGIGDKDDEVTLLLENNITKEKVERTLKAETYKSQENGVVVSKHPITQQRKNIPFYFEYIPMENTGYFQYNQCIDKNTGQFTYPDFRDFLKEMFDTLAAEKAESLIIDLRYNGGGNSILNNQFFYYIDKYLEWKDYSSTIRLSEQYKLKNPEIFAQVNNDYKRKFNKDVEIGQVIDNQQLYGPQSDIFQEIRNPQSRFYIEEPQNKFMGELILLIGNRTYSSAQMFATIFADNNLGTIIGDYTGGAPSSYGDVLSFNMPNSKVGFGVSHKQFTRPNKGLTKELTLAPHYQVFQYYDSYNNERDPVLEFAIKFLNEMWKK